MAKPVLMWAAMKPISKVLYFVHPDKDYTKSMRYSRRHPVVRVRVTKV